jgi:L-ascorbate metabolism protein UlaG (beta-lactamase superfamily)
MRLTWLDSNSWLIEMAGKQILLDPWLVGSLVFGNLPWLFKGEKTTSYSLPDKIDLILLSQGLEDHAHRPTLQQLNRQIPAVGSPNAAKVLQEVGYIQVTALEHGETFILDNSISIEAIPGSPIGPQLQENGYLLKDLISKETLYYEPHGYHSPEIQSRANIDVAITPIVELTLLKLLPIIKGQESALQLCKWLRPQVILPTAGAADIKYEGILASLIREVGSIEQFRQLLLENNLSTQVIEPKPGEAIDLLLTVLQ